MKTRWFVDRSDSVLTAIRQRALVLLLVLTQSAVTTSSIDCPIGCLCSVRTLSCAEANLTSVPANVTQPENITSLILSRNRLTELKIKDFQPFINLETLDVSGNIIRSVEDGTFKGLSHLKSADLSNNNLTSLPESSFNGLVNLSKLDLSYNKFPVLKKCLNGAAALEQLRLSNNVIGDIPEDVFTGCDAIEEIDLNGNRLIAFPSKVLQKLPNLRILVLSKNRISELGDCVLGAAKALQTLQLEDNQIENIADYAFSTNCVKQGGQVVFNSTVNDQALTLQTLDLANNHLRSISSASLSRLTNLQTLNLNSNKFTNITRGSFQNLSTVMLLLLSFMPGLVTVEPESFTNLSSLHSLYIHDCPGLSTLNPAAFNNVPSLRVLKINNNGFKYISRDLITLETDVAVNASGNPFICDCHVQWIPELFEEKSTSNTSRKNLKTIRCSSPIHLKGRRVVDLRNQDLRCSPTLKPTQARLKTAVLAASICGVILILFVVFVKCRNRICIFVKRQFRYKAHRDNRELFSVKLSEIIGDNEPDPFYEDPSIDLRLRSLVDPDGR